jgi:hypothetical protein
LQKFDIVTLFLGVYLGIQKFRARNPVYQEVDSCIKDALKLTYEHLEHQKKIFRGRSPLDPQGRKGNRRREGNEREGNRREGNGREGCSPKGNPACATGLEYQLLTRLKLLGEASLPSSYKPTTHSHILTPFV